jgi:hypothetical protein
MHKWKGEKGRIGVEIGDRSCPSGKSILSNA